MYEVSAGADGFETQTLDGANAVEVTVPNENDENDFQLATES